MTKFRQIVSDPCGNIPEKMPPSQDEVQLPAYGTLLNNTKCTYWYICTILVAIYLQFLHTQLIPPLQNRMHPPLPLFASATSPSTPPKHHSDDSIHLLEPISRNSSQPTKVQNPASNLAQACRSSFSLGRPCCVTVQIHASQRTTNK